VKLWGIRTIRDRCNGLEGFFPELVAAAKRAFFSFPSQFRGLGENPKFDFEDINYQTVIWAASRYYQSNNGI
jgi:hypothetical protein